MTEQEWWKVVSEVSQQDSKVLFYAFADWWEERGELVKAGAFRYLADKGKYPVGLFWDDAESAPYRNWWPEEEHESGLPRLLFQHLAGDYLYMGWYIQYKSQLMALVCFMRAWEDLHDGAGLVGSV